MISSLYQWHLGEDEASANLYEASDEELLAFLHKLLERYALWCHLRREHPALRPGIRGWVSFKLPETLDIVAVTGDGRGSSRRIRTSADQQLRPARGGPSWWRRARNGWFPTIR